MGQLSDIVRTELQKEFFKEHRLLFVTNPRDYCRQCKKYVEENCRERLIKYKRKIKDEETLNSSDFI